MTLNSLRIPGQTNIESLFEIGDRIYSGGQGLIRHGTRISDGRPVVIKRYSIMEDIDWDVYLSEKVGAAREISFLELANREGIANVPKIIQWGITDGWEQPFVIFDPIHGESLRSHVLSPGYIPRMDEIRKVSGSLTNVLSYAHNLSPKMIVHRDVNPENVMMNDEVILMDWGSSTPTSGRTELRTSMMTLGFTAPEVSDPSKFSGVDARADVYGLGKTLEFMLFGQKFLDQYGVISDADYSGLNIDNGVKKVLRTATQFQPRNRYSTVRELDGHLRGAPNTLTKPKPVPEKKTTYSVGISNQTQPAALETGIGVLGLYSSPFVLLGAAIQTSDLEFSISAAICFAALSIITDVAIYLRRNSVQGGRR